MRKFIWLANCVIILVTGCEKNHDDLSKVCLQARYVGHYSGCPSIIQLINVPRQFPYHSSYHSPQDSIYENALIAVELPEILKNGKPFYMTIRSIDSVFISTQSCPLPAYSVDIETYSDSMCVVPNTH